MNESNLKLLGLTDNEIKVYIYILQNKRSNGTNIKNKTGVANSRVYSAIDSLISKGLISYEKTARGRLYSAVDPSVIKELTEERRRKIEETIPFLKGLQKKEKANTETSIFEGFKGFKTALFNFVDECPSGEMVHIIGFSNQAYKNEKLAALLRDINKKSIQKKHKFKMILDDKDNKFFETRKREGISEIRFMEKGFKSPAAIDIFGDTVYILMWDEHPYAFRIKNKNIADGFKTYFDFLWNIAKP